jgi:pilus assembly protein CpaC
MGLVLIAVMNLCGQATGSGQSGSTAAAQQPAPAAQQPAESENVTGSRVVHILVGHSVVIHTDARLRRVLVGNPAAVTTTTTAPNEVVLTAVAPGSSTVVLWQVNNESSILETFCDLDVSMLREAVARTFPGEQINVEAEEGRVILTGTVSSQAVADQIAKMAAPFAKDVVNSFRIALPTRQKQILLKVRFAQVDRTKLDQLGINLFSSHIKAIGSTGTQQFPGPTFGGSTVDPVTGVRTTTFNIGNTLNLFFIRPDIGLGATIQDLQQRNILQILAEPDLLAANGEAAKFLAGGELPYPVVSGSGTGNQTVTVQFKPFGVKLEFTGFIEDDDTIRLKVFPEVSSLDFTNAVTISGFVLPAIATRHAETVVELRNGQSFGIAGLLDQRTTAQFSKVPGIGDIPILGLLFRSKSVSKINSELVVIVTPYIVDPASGQGAPAEVPKMPSAPLDPKQFDKKIPSGGNK